MTRRVSLQRRAKEIAAHTQLWSTCISKQYVGFCGVLRGIGPMQTISRRRRS